MSSMTTTRLYVETPYVPMTTQSLTWPGPYWVSPYVYTINVCANNPSGS
jgi:hypothetical protein